jgi:hypothetical protein
VAAALRISGSRPAGAVYGKGEHCQAYAVSMKWDNLQQCRRALGKGVVFLGAGMLGDR